MVTVLDRLLSQADNNETREHMIEQSHYAVDNVHQKSLARFDSLVDEISEELGQPEYNCNTENDDNRNPMPKWVTGSRLGEASSKVLRLCYWKRENGISYLLLRMELDSKDRPTYYDVILGGRRKVRGETLKMDKLRSNSEPTFIGWLKERFLPAKKEG